MFPNNESPIPYKMMESRDLINIVITDESLCFGAERP